MPASTSALRQQWVPLWGLAGPSILSSLGMMAIGVVDTLMVSRVSVEALAAAALGGVLWSGTVYVGSGIMRGMEPFVSQAHGAGDGRAAALALQRGLVLALLVSVPVVLVLSQTNTLLLAAGQDPALAQAAHNFIQIQLVGAPFVLVFTAMRCYLESRTLVRPAMWNMWIANGFNVVANWALIFGHLGFEPMGLHGAGMASTATRVLATLVLFAQIVRGGLHHGAWFGWQRACLSPRGLLPMLSVGTAISAHLATEIWAWAGSSLIAGRLGEVAVAAHQIVITMASLTFMVPMGVSMAAATRVGNLIGKGKPQQVRDAGKVAIIMGVGAMVCFGVAFLVFRNQLGQLFTDAPAVLALCALALPIAAAFQVVDGAQVVITGILRGMGRTRMPAIANFTAYWVFALPVGWWMTFRGGMGIQGIWLALAMGLAICAVILSVYLVRTPIAERLQG